MTPTVLSGPARTEALIVPRPSAGLDPAACHTRAFPAEQRRRILLRALESGQEIPLLSRPDDTSGAWVTLAQRGDVLVMDGNTRSGAFADLSDDERQGDFDLTVTGPFVGLRAAVTPACGSGATYIGLGLWDEEEILAHLNATLTDLDLTVLAANNGLNAVRQDGRQRQARLSGTTLARLRQAAPALGAFLSAPAAGQTRAMLRRVWAEASTQGTATRLEAAQDAFRLAGEISVHLPPRASVQLFVMPAADEEPMRGVSLDLPERAVARLLGEALGSLNPQPGDRVVALSLAPGGRMPEQHLIISSQLNG